jgi:hypothetical protein
MRHAILLLIPLLAACGGGGGGGGETAERDFRATVQTADLTGLYEARGEEQRSRICMISKPSGVAAFALVIERPNGSCSGAGDAVRTNELLRLTMTGDEECVIQAQIEETRVTFPSTVPESCAYYCAPGATLAGERFEKTGGTAEDAMRATDLAGDPLCA